MSAHHDTELEKIVVEVGLGVYFDEIADLMSPAVRLVPDNDGSCYIGGVPDMEVWPSRDRSPLLFVAALHVPSLVEEAGGMVPLLDFEVEDDDGWWLLFSQHPDDPAYRYDFVDAPWVVAAETLDFRYGKDLARFEPLPQSRYRPELSWSVDVPELERLSPAFHVDPWKASEMTNELVVRLHGDGPLHQVGGQPWHVDTDPRDVAASWTKARVEYAAVRDMSEFDVDANLEDVDDGEELSWLTGKTLENSEAGRERQWELFAQFDNDDFGGSDVTLSWGGFSGRAFWLVPSDYDFGRLVHVVQSDNII